ncbi:hypothetical protein ACP70R_022411 [Stipagrostis hirtigluma subsp. patula]
MAKRSGAAAPQEAQRLGPVAAEAEVAPPRAHFTAVVELLRRLWTRLPRLGWLLRLFWTRRKISATIIHSPTMSEPKAGAELKKPGRKKGLAAGHGMPKLHLDAKAAAAARTPPAQRHPSPSSPPPLLEVNGERISREEQKQYKEYCKKNASCPEKIIACHMCFFHGQRCPNGERLESEILVHCVDKHKDIGLPCVESKCRVRVGSLREQRLHFHYCHILPAGWWSQEE